MAAVAVANQLSQVVKMAASRSPLSTDIGGVFPSQLWCFSVMALQVLLDQHAKLSHGTQGSGSGPPPLVISRGVQTSSQLLYLPHTCSSVVRVRDGQCANAKLTNGSSRIFFLSWSYDEVILWLVITVLANSLYGYLHGLEQIDFVSPGRTASQP